MNFAEEHNASLYLVFVCTGNICRSPMAEIIVRNALIDANLANDVLLRSCGIGGWHVGQKADYRAIAELATIGLDGTKHRANQLSGEHQSADLFIALDNGHIRDLKAWGIPRNRIRLMRSFDPQAPQCAEVDDPYYGDASAFTQTRKEIEAATPGLIDWIRQQLEASESTTR
ncbi:low molecular weight protein-tyrosine-phosphatase [Corynebacterium freiburgense]|uniref:low molecular weight protein-tyrosine-phosphatase n=1 Tax=Corynebacterium freiburgense TaxID=556548 RepID=UPI000427873C|nr:low molecular weight protein-tyrosine-phosphatase [Corynebacterium freiburgense]